LVSCDTGKCALGFDPVKGSIDATLAGVEALRFEISERCLSKSAGGAPILVSGGISSALSAGMAVRGRTVRWGIRVRF